MTNTQHKQFTSVDKSFEQIHQWQITHIKTAQKQAIDGKFAPEDEWRRALKQYEL